MYLTTCFPDLYVFTIHGHTFAKSMNIIFESSCTWWSGRRSFIQIPIQSIVAEINDIYKNIKQKEDAGSFHLIDSRAHTCCSRKDERKSYKKLEIWWRGTTGIKGLVAIERDRDPAVEPHRPAVIPGPRSGSIDPGSRNQPWTLFPASVDPTENSQYTTSIIFAWLFLQCC
jgi:hypothetical protein